MTPRTPQCEFFWPFNLSSEFSRVPGDSKFPLLGVWASPSHLAQSGVATEMANGLSQIAIEKLDKNNFQVWKFRIMNFLMGKGYWEFITGDEKEPPLPETPHNNKFKPIKLGMKSKESLILAFCECVRFHDCAYSRCKITQASLGYIDEDV